MTTGLAPPSNVLREVFEGTAANFQTELPNFGGPRENAGAENRHLLSAKTQPEEASLHKSYGLALSLTGLAGAAFLLAIVALVLALRGSEPLSDIQAVKQAVDFTSGEMAQVKSRLDVVSTEVAQISTAPSSRSAPLAPEIAENLKAEVREEVGAVAQRLDKAVDKVEADEAGLGRRLAKVEADQASQGSLLQSLELRMSPAEAAPASAQPSAHPHAIFRLLSVKGGVALVSGPEGEKSVSVGDTLSDYGKVLRIERHGRKSVLIAERGKLTRALPHAPVKSSPAAGSI